MKVLDFSTVKSTCQFKDQCRYLHIKNNTEFACARESDLRDQIDKEHNDAEFIPPCDEKKPE